VEGARNVAPPTARRFRPWLAALCMAGAATPLLAALQHAGAGPCRAQSALAGAVCTAALSEAKRAPDVLAFYRVHRARPLWVGPSGLKPEARAAVEDMKSADRDGLDPAAYVTPKLTAALNAARPGNAASLARAELALSQAFGTYAQDMHDGIVDHPLSFADPALNLRPITRRAALEEAAAQPTIAKGIKAAERMNPLYAALRGRLVAFRARWSKLPHVLIPPGPSLGPGAQDLRVTLLRKRLGLAPGGGYAPDVAKSVRAFQAAHGLIATGRADGETLAALNRPPEMFERTFERLILANMGRARVIPPDPGRRFILVDAAGQQLSLYENGKVAHTMAVAVGKPSDPTPEMAGLIRWAVYNPYWNVPPDLVRERLARKVLAQGLGAFSGQHMQALADWSADAKELDPSMVDWWAVASGGETLRVRQKPGPDNMMGRVKFMLPNPLGVYLHDTPTKSVFLASQRNVSHGCVRLADALTLARWLMPKTTPPPPGSSETPVDLDPPVPVYILYLTVAPTPDGLAFHRDVYGRDSKLLASMQGSKA
jgi:L,D-transpeptidase YcbB